MKNNKKTAVGLRLASPETILKWSHGEIKKPETINYRTGRSERDGLFDERIFGPDKDYECYCGKYKKIRYNGVVCEKCGVEITKSIVRRERMGHVQLAAPVSHIWFLRGIPSRMSLLLDVPTNKLENVVYFAGYIITKINTDERERVLRDLDTEFKTKMRQLDDNAKEQERLKDRMNETKKELMSLEKFLVLNEVQYFKFSKKYSTVFEAKIGAEALYDILKNLDLEQLAIHITDRLEKVTSVIIKQKLEKRLAFVKTFIRSKLRPEWMFITVLPILPPGLRPMVGLDGGRFATSDINDLYRRVINRNNRLKKLIELSAPEVILRNEKRILQEAVDTLFDNSIKKQNGTVATNLIQKRALKSLADHLKGKQGIFRQNLLGKRVDYSGRSVIVVGPRLQLNQCGIPKNMALELFKPFVISEIIKREYAFNIRGATKMVDEHSTEVWEILEECIKGKYVLLNRAPTLHRLSIQAFHPILIEGKAIQIHPMVCSAFNADFDGDQMAVHLPLSYQAQQEADQLMSAAKNLLKPQSGDPITAPAQDMVLGVYWMTKMITDVKGEGKIFGSPNEAILAYEYNIVDFRAKILVVGTDKEKYSEFAGKPFETTVGRLMFNAILPVDYPYVNMVLRKKEISQLVNTLIANYDLSIVPKFLDALKRYGFEYATLSGTTMSYADVIVPTEKQALVERGEKEVLAVYADFEDGIISDHERYLKVIEIWERAKKELNEFLKRDLDKTESVSDMMVSGARGSMDQLSQSAGMKGIIQSASGMLLEFPIISNYKEGFSPLEYFINTTTARKGLADTALKTAQAGYLTRRLHDVVQDVVITEYDCLTENHIVASEENYDGIVRSIVTNVFGRTAYEDVRNERGELIIGKNEIITKNIAEAIEKSGIPSVKVRSPLTCGTNQGICQMCFGLDLGRNKIIKLGEAVGTIASQAIGEPGTQLTLRTFHSGGVAGRDITQGLPRIEEVFECRLPKSPMVISHAKGEITDIRKEGNSMIISILGETATMVSKGGRSKKMIEKMEHEYIIDPRRTILSKIKKGVSVELAEPLTDGSANIREIFEIGGKEKAENYIIAEINRVYELHSAPISSKYPEVIARQMFSRRRVTKVGDTRFALGEIVEAQDFNIENARTREIGGEEAGAKTILMGISDISITTKSWLSSASFQHTTRVLVSNAVKGELDILRGLKENIIVGNLIPAGTGFDDKFIDFDLPLPKDSKSY